MSQQNADDYSQGKNLEYKSYWMLNSITLETPCTTPRGSRVKKVNVCLDIDYDIVGCKVLLTHAKLCRYSKESNCWSSRLGAEIVQWGNVYSSTTGEEWAEVSVCSELRLLQEMRKEMYSRYGYELRNVLLSNWGEDRRCSAARSFVDAINLQLPSEKIQEWIDKERGSKRIRMNYSKSLFNEYSRRDVTVCGIDDNCLISRDNKDGRIKRFRLDRITEAVPEVPYRIK